MNWVVVQLSSWSKSHRSLAEIRLSVSQCLKSEDITIFIPVVEDVCGKSESSYSEYIFVEYRPKLNYYNLEEGHEFVRVLRNSKSHQPQIVSDDDINQIYQHVVSYKRYDVGQRVKIVSGFFRGNYGEITRLFDGDVEVKTYVGQEILNIIIPAQHIKTDKNFNKKNVVGNFEKLNTRNEPKINFSVPVLKKFGEVPRVLLVRRGSKNSRLLIEGRSVVVPNHELYQYLPSTDTLTPTVPTEISVISDFVWINIGDDCLNPSLLKYINIEPSFDFEKVFPAI